MGVYADVAQLVEHHLAKVGVAGSNPVVRSRYPQVRCGEARRRDPRLRPRAGVALILPFDEEVSSDHPDAPVRYRWGDVPLPRRELPLRERHDGKEIGILSSFVLARSGFGLG
jgi:hypothetical protein